MLLSPEVFKAKRAARTYQPEILTTKARRIGVFSF